MTGPIRPLFPEGYYRETQVIATVLSLDPANEPDIIAMIGASIALGISDIPFAGLWPLSGWERWTARWWRTRR